MSETPEAKTPDDYQAEIDRLTRELNDVTEERDEAVKRHEKATAHIAEKATELKTAQAALDVALKAQKRAEDARDQAEKERDAISQDITEARRQRDEWKKQHHELSKGAQAFVGAASKPITGPCTIDIRHNVVGQFGTIFKLAPGEQYAGMHVEGTSIYVAIAMPAAVEMPVPTEDVPEQGDAAKPNDDEAIPQAA